MKLFRVLAWTVISVHPRLVKTILVFAWIAGIACKVQIFVTRIDVNLEKNAMETPTAPILFTAIVVFATVSVRLGQIAMETSSAVKASACARIMWIASKEMIPLFVILLLVLAAEIEKEVNGTVLQRQELSMGKMQITSTEEV